LLKEMSELLKQFVSLTSATSWGSAKVMSTHCFLLVLVFQRNLERIDSRNTTQHREWQSRLPGSWHCLPRLVLEFHSVVVLEAGRMCPGMGSWRDRRFGRRAPWGRTCWVVRCRDRWCRSPCSCRRRLLRGLGTSRVVGRWHRRLWARGFGLWLYACRRLGMLAGFVG
jgi:hypothetical protein